MDTDWGDVLQCVQLVHGIFLGAPQPSQEYCNRKSPKGRDPWSRVGLGFPNFFSTVGMKTEHKRFLSGLGRRVKKRVKTLHLWHLEIQFWRGYVGVGFMAGEDDLEGLFQP